MALWRTLQVTRGNFNNGPHLPCVLKYQLASFSRQMSGGRDAGAGSRQVGTQQDMALIRLANLCEKSQSVNKLGNPSHAQNLMHGELEMKIDLNYYYYYYYNNHKMCLV